MLDGADDDDDGGDGGRGSERERGREGRRGENLYILHALYLGCKRSRQRQTERDAVRMRDGDGWTGESKQVGKQECRPATLTAAAATAATTTAANDGQRAAATAARFPRTALGGHGGYIPSIEYRR